MTNIIFTGTTPKELRKFYPNSKFLPEILDNCIIGVHLKSNSIIYDINKVINSKIETEFPEGFCDEYDKSYTIAADFIFENLCKTDGNIGINDLEEFMKGETNYSSHNPPFSLLNPIEIDSMFKIQFNNN